MEDMKTTKYAVPFQYLLWTLLENDCICAVSSFPGLICQKYLVGGGLPAGSPTDQLFMAYQINMP